MNTDLIEIDWRKDPLALAKCFFNRLENIRFNDYLKHLTAFHSMGINDDDCDFEHDADPAGGDPFKGVRIRIGEDTITIDFNTFKELLIQAAETWAARNPQEGVETLRMLEEFRTTEYKNPYSK